MKRGALYISIALLFAGCSSAPKTKLHPVQDEAIARNQRGFELVDAGKQDKALVEFRHSLKLNRSIDNTKGVVISQLNIARTCLTLERYGDAGGPIMEAVALAGSLGEKPLLAASYATSGKYMYTTGDDKKALEHINMAIEIDRKEGYKEIGERLNILGLLLIREGKVKEAEEVLKEALKKNLDAGNDSETANSYRAVGDLLEKKGLNKEAGDAFEKALAMDKQTGDSRKIAIDLKKMGDLSIKMNDLKGALAYFIRSYDVNRNANRTEQSAQDLDSVIKIAGEIGDSKKLMFYMEEKKRMGR